jgi:hypothetical protein
MRYNLRFEYHQPEIYFTNEKEETTAIISLSTSTAVRIPLKSKQRIKLCLCTLKKKDIIKNITNDLLVKLEVNAEGRIYYTAGTRSMNCHIVIIDKVEVPTLRQLCLYRVHENTTAAEIPRTLVKELATEQLYANVPVDFRLIPPLQKSPYEIYSTEVSTCICRCKCGYRWFKYNSRTVRRMIQCRCQPNDIVSTLYF